MAKYLVKIEVQKPQPNPTGEVDYSFTVGKQTNSGEVPFDTTLPGDIDRLAGGFEGARKTAQEVAGRDGRNINSLIILVP